MKLKAAALYYALIFALLIAIVSGLLILFSFYSKTEVNVYLNKQKLIRNVHSGFELLKSSNFPYQTATIDLFGKENDSIYIVKKHWGLFDMYAVKATSRNDFVEKSAIIGAKSSKYDRTSLYLAETNKALSISGETRIKGDAFLSKAGVKRTSIEGKNYIGKELIYGQKFLSEKQLPVLNEGKQKYFENMLNGNFQNEYELKEISELASVNTISNAFSDKTTVFRSNGRIYLNNINLKGNIVVYSNQEIVVDRSCIFDNIVLVAPTVILKDNLKGSMQIIASDSIVLGKDAHLDYPSSLAIKSKTNGFIKIGSKSTIVGDIILNGVNNLKQSNFISIEENVKIEGNVYSNGIISLKGDVYGSVFCSKFYLKTPSAIYENYLLDAVIDNTIKSKDYLSGFIFEEKVVKKVASWY